MYFNVKFTLSRYSMIQFLMELQLAPVGELLATRCAVMVRLHVVPQIDLTRVVSAASWHTAGELLSVVFGVHVQLEEIIPMDPVVTELATQICWFGILWCVVCRYRLFVTEISLFFCFIIFSFSQFIRLFFCFS